MQPGLEVRVGGWDEYVRVVELHAANSLFAGVAELYLGEEGLRPLIRTMSGFPSRPRDGRELNLGEPGAGSVRLVLRSDARGCVEIEVDLKAHGRLADGHAARLRFAVEPSSLDAFVRALESLQLTKGSTCRLSANT